MNELLNIGQALSRSEMKKLMAGSDECEEGNGCTDCLICDYSQYCVSFNGQPPGPGCTWGHCGCD